MADPQPDSVARTRLTQLFRFLQALDQLRNPVVRDISEQPWVLWLDDLPKHSCITLERVEEPRDVEAGEATISRGQILTVKRPALTECPKPPDELVPWLAPEWDAPDAPPELLALYSNPDSRYAETTPGEEIEHLFQAFLERHRRWAEAETPARQTMALFERLYALKSNIERESERVELILADGLLQWRTRENLVITHPILLQRVQLTFDPAVPSFEIVVADSPPDLYSALFRSVAEVSANALAQIRKELDEGLCHPLGGASTTAFLRRSIAQLSPRGKFQEQYTAETTIGEPRISRRPVVFLRRRTLGFGKAIEAILEDISERDDLPRSLVTILGIESPNGQTDAQDDKSTDWSSKESEDEILLTQPANAEQIEAAKRLERHGLVLVQGPPGTGKTHTIGNLIGHLLAQGKSILVTSHTAKALKVLRDKVVEALRPLCVSVLDDSRSQMADAIDAILDRLSRSDSDSLDVRAAALEEQRHSLLGELRTARQALVYALQDEYRPIVVAGKQYSPSEAARVVNAAAATSDWIPAPVAPGEPAPLSAVELQELYATNDSTRSGDEGQLGPALPEIEKLLSPAEFTDLVSKRQHLASIDMAHSAELFDKAVARTADGLTSLLERAQVAASLIGDSPAWQLSTIEAGQKIGPRRQAWEQLISLIRTTNFEADSAHKHSIEMDPTLPTDKTTDQIIGVLNEILAHMNNGGHLGTIQLLMRPEWKQIIRGSRVNGRPPSRREHFLALKACAQFLAARNILLERWQRQVAQLGGPSSTDLGNEPERACQQLSPAIEKRLNWHKDNWTNIKAEFTEVGFNFEGLLERVPEDLGQFGSLRRLHSTVMNHLPTAFASETARLLWKDTERQLKAQEDHLHAKVMGEGDKTIATELLTATRDLDATEYEAAYRRFAELRNRSVLVARRSELLRIVDKVAPSWAAAIATRKGVHGQSSPPGEIQPAWLWRQLEDELTRRAHTDITELQDKVERLSADLRALTVDLVDTKAWASQVHRTSLKQRNAIGGWKAFMQKLPKGQGPRRQRLLAEARKLMPTCQTAIPVWIMPLSRVVENFDPKENRFDVVIIDEASQADVMALAALYLGKEIMIVGDHEQVTPAAVGQKQDDVVKLMDEHLLGVTNAKLYDGQTSVYDLAKTAFPGVLVLLEHFRCVEPIIQFSNHLSYNGKIIPLRDPGDVVVQPPCVVYRVEAGESEGKINEEEAEAIASLVVACTEQPEYRRSTFGIISMVGDEQALLIDQLLQRRLSPIEYSNHKVQCGNSAQFQGDERNVIFLSMVDTPPSNPPLSLRAEGFMGLYKKRFNVAASRGKDQMWVVHSLNPPRDLQVDDLRYKLIKHAENPHALIAEIERRTAQAESEFERQVIQRLTEAGFPVHPQWKVGAYRIDMVVGDRHNRVAIECDGDRWHPPEKTADDMAREALLERLGWRKFIRIRGSKYFRAPDETMRQVIEQLRSAGIKPRQQEAPDGRTEHRNELEQRVITRAAELRREWRERPEDQEFGKRRRGWPKRPVAGGQEGTQEPHATMEPSNNDGMTSATERSAIIPTPGQVESRSEPADNPQNVERAVAGLAGAFAQLGFEIIDKRPMGGNLWVVGGVELKPTIDEWATRGVVFHFKPTGGKATQHRPAWFTTSAT